ncbi:MAG: porphobilinogen synthase [Phycisphaeraceae bacterium]|nr:porphobilinogen synthase [Phycisphaeraceae bacterium]
MSAPLHRPRRLRKLPAMRDALAEVTLEARHLVHPVFVTSRSESRIIESMPGVCQWPVEEAVERIAAWRELGIVQFLLFGVVEPDAKDGRGSMADADHGPVMRLIEAVGRARLDVILWADVCLCEYTDHGHCGLLREDGLPGDVENDPTIDRLGEIAAHLAAAGADVVAPSAMMDGQVRAIRQALSKAGHDSTALCSYAVKYASNLYGPFRDAGEGGMRHGDRRGYQMDDRRTREWAREIALDIEEGADMVIVKPAHTYLDIVASVRRAADCPVVGYHVSGEYAMLRAAAERGWLDLREAGLEVTRAIRRAGADLVISYLSPELAQWLD